MQTQILKTKTLLLFLISLFFLSGTNLNATPPPVMVNPAHTKEITKTKRELRKERKLERKIKRFTKKFKKWTEGKSNSKRIATIGVVVLLIGIILMITAGGGGIGGLTQFIIGIAAAVAGLVTLLVGAVMKKD